MLESHIYPDTKIYFRTAFDTETNEKVAIKKMQAPFQMTMSAKRAYREFILLTTIKHPNVSDWILGILKNSSRMFLEMVLTSSSLTL